MIETVIIQQGSAYGCSLLCYTDESYTFEKTTFVLRIFAKLFKKETGATPHQFLLSTRIAAAKYNLSNTGMTIREIANSCGFEDVSAFCSQFRKRVGCTPGAFRTMAL